jgi:hypothetical protein
MVSCTFLVLSCIPVGFYGSVSGIFCLLCFVVALNLFFKSYQDGMSMGLAYYEFLFIGLATWAFAPMLFFVPVLWLLMGIHLQSLSWRTWRASLLGLLTPYWVALPWFLYHDSLESYASHFTSLFQLHLPYDYATLPTLQLLNVAFVVVLLLIGAVHFWFNSIDEKIRIRQFYGFFIFIAFYALAWIVLQPQYVQPLLWIVILCTSPLVAHFFTFTKSRATNVFFLLILTFCLLLTALNIFDPFFSNFPDLIARQWNGLLNF